MNDRYCETFQNYVTESLNEKNRNPLASVLIYELLKAEFVTVPTALTSLSVVRSLITALARQQLPPPSL